MWAAVQEEGDIFMSQSLSKAGPLLFYIIVHQSNPDKARPWEGEVACTPGRLLLEKSISFHCSQFLI